MSEEMPFMITYRRYLKGEKTRYKRFWKFFETKKEMDEEYSKLKKRKRVGIAFVTRYQRLEMLPNE